MGLRRLKSKYKPIPYCLKKEQNGEKVSGKKDEKAELAAKFLKEKFWKKPEQETECEPIDK